MKLSIPSILLGLFIILLCSNTHAQNTYTPDTTGSINFNLRSSTLPHSKYHTLTLCGCNTRIDIDSRFWQGPNKGYLWNDTNEVLPGIPIGQQIDQVTKDTFYVSKYYIASPPVFRKNAQLTHEKDTLYDIGLVTPDEFIFEGENPVQLVYMDYSILKPMYIKYFEVALDSTFDSLGVDFVPFRVEAPNFPWLESSGVKGGMGASGIGVINKTSSSDSTTRLFLPYYYVKNTTSNTEDSTRRYLDFKVSILNDILFHYEATFMVDGVPKPYINLNDYADAKTPPKISLSCVYRKELPIGCKPYKPQPPYDK